MNHYHIVTIFVIFFFPLPTPAPVPRCSPLFIINKLAEFNNLMSDSNPYFPVPPCEYGNAMNALRAGDFRSVFVLAEPTKIPLHNFYELVWFLNTGFPRFMRMVTGKQKFITKPKILRERYKHHTPYTRTVQLGQGTKRRPEIIDNFAAYKSVVGGKIRALLREGPDKYNKPYTPQGPLLGSKKARKPVPSKSRANNIHQPQPQPQPRPRPRPETVTLATSGQGGWRPIVSPYTSG